jgi:ATP-binding cassette subfamily F protein uup
MPVLSARGLEKAFGTRVLFSALDVTIRRGDRVGLLGVNGAGKSTLLRVLAGLEPPDVGTVERRREAKVLYLPQEPALDATKTAQQIVEAADPGEEGTHDDHAAPREHVAAEMLDRVGIADREKLVSEMSGGEKRRVALAALLVAKPDLAILDEPTNHLDADTIEWLEGYLASQRGAVLMVTHDRYVLDTVCERILELANGKLYEYEGSYGDYLEKKAEREAHEERVERNRQNLIRREKAWLLRGAKARTTKQKARIKRAEAVMAQAGPAAREDLDIAVTTAPRLGKTVLETHDLVLELGGRTLVRDLTLHLRGGERIGIVGPNGAGKTTLLRAVTGELSPKSGTVVRGAQTKIAMLDQGRSELRDDWTIVENVVDREGAHRTGAGVVTFGDETVEVRTYLERFLFDSHKQMQKVGALSGGERARVTLAKVLTRGANLLLLDEPTNDLDVSTLSALEAMLESWPGAALVVSHDRWFLDRTATSILAFERDSRCVLYPGNFSQYRDLKDAAASRTGPGQGSAPTPRSSPPSATLPEARTPTSTSTSPPTATSLKPLTYAERIELEGIMDVIAKAEDEVARLEKELADPSFYATRAKEAGKMNDALAAAKAEAHRLTERWESLESRRDLKK